MELMDVLKRFNRKERFHLLRHALGYDKDSFRLGGAFREALGANIGQRIPRDALVMMDYHLDWVGMALWLADRNEMPTKRAPWPSQGRVKGNQEDVDLLVAFKSEGKDHVVLVEAKGGSPWRNSQLDSKARRLSDIFGRKIADGANVRPHFVLIAPKGSSAIEGRTWPCWMKDAVGHQMVLPWPLMMKPDALRHGRQGPAARSVRSH